MERFRGRIYPLSKAVDEILVSPAVARITYAQSRALEYRPAKLTDRFGPHFATFWFKLKAQIPKEWHGKRVDLLWAAHSEATVWLDGKIAQGLNWEQGWRCRPDVILRHSARGNEIVSVDLEMACNGLFGRKNEDMPQVYPYLLQQCDIAAFDPVAWDLYNDLTWLQQLEAELDKSKGATDLTFAGELLAELNTICNTMDPDAPSSWAAAKKITTKLLSRRTPTQTHELTAIGHAHIDCAWLWPVAETVRKCVRSFSSQLAYMEAYPEYKFACSQAWQYQVIKDTNRDLYDRIKKKVKSGQWVPVGGSWIEPDCNIPSGESLCRQFLYGQRFFKKEFGVHCNEFWNPDVFGYNGQLPQIMKLAGIRRFLTQKLSGNRFNKPSHHTFTWQGIDGSEVIAHFPPADDYNCSADVRDLRKNMLSYKDHERSRYSIMLYGYGDGGGGPTKEMIEGLRRSRDLQGLPRVSFRSSDEFFTALEDDCTDRPIIIGELYYEFHRGTYTTHARTKRNNRQCEFLLHNAEFLSVTAAAANKSFVYPVDELDRIWKLQLFNSFHDILPGSSIAMVYDDADREYDDIRQSAQKLAQSALESLDQRKSNKYTPINTIGFDRSEVAELPDGSLLYAKAPSYGVGSRVASPDKVSATKGKGAFVLENAHIRASLSHEGSLVSLIHKSTGREVMAAPGDLRFYDDRPNQHGAWDIDPFLQETESPCAPAHSAKLSSRELRAEVVFQRKVGKTSNLAMVARLDADSRRLEFHCTADWHEDYKMLKAIYPVNIRSMNATYEMQFGHVERPTHFNTSYDLAKYEVCAHKWVDFSEHGFGVTLLSDCKYGFSTFGNTMRISLLRAPKNPDPTADLGSHEFSYAIMPHAGTWQDAGVVAEGYKFNVPLILMQGLLKKQSYASCADPNLVLDTIKKAQDSDAIVMRLYECHGSRGVARINVGFPFKTGSYCNLLEQTLDPVNVRDGIIELPYQPFEIISVILR